jgi:hypothetical protein
MKTFFEIRNGFWEKLFSLPEPFKLKTLLSQARLFPNN